jgi:AcrR family transcriptional regulator
MTRRSAAAAETRQRVIDAALVVYERDGFGSASIQSIARQAEVSPATVLNHFDDSDALMLAAVEGIRTRLEFPSPDAFADLDDLQTRIRTLSRELAAFYEKTERWYAVYSREPDLPILQRATVEFFEHVAALTRAALGPGQRDKRTLSVVMTLTGPGNYGGLRHSGMSTRAAADAVSDVLIAWLATRTKKTKKKSKTKTKR